MFRLAQISLLFLLPCLIGSHEASAEVRLGGTLGASHRKAGESQSPYLGPGFGGMSLGALILVDADVSSVVALGGELSLAGDISGAQSQRAPGGSNSLLSRHHDTIVSFMSKVGSPSTHRFRIAGVAGAGMAWRRTTRTGTSRRFGPPLTSTPLPETTLSNAKFAVTFGGDGTLAISERVRVLGVVRIHHVVDDDRAPDGVVHRGVSSWIVRWGIGAALQF
jgi:hypothetical protein